MAITFKVGFQVNDKDLANSLSKISNDIESAFQVKGNGMSKEIAEATKQAMVLEKALKRATTDKGISYYSLNAELTKAGTTAAQLTAKLAAGGATFKNSLNAANTALALSNRQVISLNAKIAEMSRVMIQSFKFSAAQFAIREISMGFAQAVQWVKELSDAVNQIGIVTGKTGAQLDEITNQAIKGARELRVAAKEYAEGALIFYQQGLNDQEVIKRNEITIKAAKAAGQSVSEMSSQLTSIWNNYKMAGEEQYRAASVGAKMAAQTAVDFSDIATAMQTAAAPAAQMGVSYDSLAAIIATVGDTTQQSASVIGNAFKTIFSRFQQLKSEGTDGEVTLNRVSQQLQELGVNVLDSSSNLRQLDEVIWEVGDAWDNWSTKQQLAIAQLVGGTRQYGQFLALMNNYDKYQENLKSAQSETGSTLESQYSQYLESVESLAKNAKEAWNQSFSELIDPDAIKDFYRAIETVGVVFGEFLKGLDGAKGVALVLAGIFSRQIVKGIQGATSQVKAFVNNLTPNLRQKSIDKEYDAAINEVSLKKKGTSDQNLKYDLTAQESKLKFDRQIAKVNTEINDKLTYASGAYKIQLQYQQQLLANSQKLYQSAMDRLTVLEQEGQKLQNNYNLMQQRAQNDYNSAYDDAQNLQDQVVEKKTVLSDLKETDPTNTKAIAQLESEVRKLEIAWEKAEKKVLDYETKVKQLGGTIKNSSGQDIVVKSADKQLNKVIDATASWIKSAGKGEVTTAKLKEEMRKLAQEAKLSGKDLDQFEEVIKSLRTNMSSENFTNFIAELEKIQGVSDETKARLNQLTDAAERAETAGNMKNTGSKPPKPSNEPDPNIKTENLANAAQGFISFTGAVTLATSALSMFMALGNEDLSLGEKIITLTSGVGLLVPALMQGYGALMSLTNAGIKLIPTFASIVAGIVGINTAELTASGTTLTFGMVLEAAGNKGLVAWLKMLGVFSLVVIAIAAVAAAVYGLIKLLGVLWGEYKANTLDGRIKSASEAAKSLEEDLAQAKAEAEELKNAFDNYDQVVSKLDECTQGTQEWQDALRNVNNEVLSLMKEYPQLASMVNENGESAITRNAETGQLEVADWARQELTQQSNEKVTMMTSASIQANQEVRDLTTQKEKNKLGVNGPIWDVLLNKGDQLAGLSGEKLTSQVQQILEGAGFDNLNFEYFAGVIESLGEDFTELSGTIKENTIATETENQAIAEQILQDSGFKGSKISGQAGNEYNRLSDEAYDEALKKAKSRTLFNAGTADAKEAFNKYAELTGLNKKDDFKVTNYRGDGTVDIKYRDEEGNEKTDNIKAEEIAQVIAAAEASEQLATDMTALATTVNRLENSTDLASQGLASFLENGDLSEMTQEEFSAISGKVTDEASAKQYLLDSGLSEDQAAYYASDLYNQISSIDWEGIINTIGEGTEGALSQLSVGEAQKLANAYEKIGETAGTQYQDMTKSIIQAAGDKGDEVAKKLGEVDFSDYDSIEDFKDYINSLDIDLESAGVNLDSYIKRLQVSNNAMRDVDLDAVTEKYAKIQSLFEDFNIGDTISDTDFQDLDENLQQYFTKMADGTYQLVGDAETFYNTVKKNQQEEFKKTMDSANANKEYAQNQINKTNYFAEGYRTEDENGEVSYGKLTSTVNVDAQEEQSLLISQQMALFNQYKEEIGATEEEMQRYDEILQKVRNDQKLSAEDLQFLATQSQNATQYLETQRAAVESNGQAYLEAQQAYLTTASTLQELDTLSAQIAATNGLSSQAYSAALINLATQFDNTTREVEEYQRALQFGSEAEIAAAEDAVRGATLIGEAAEKYGLETEDLEAQAKELAKAYDLSAEQAADLAVKNQRMNKGISQLVDNWDDWKKTLKTTKKTSQDYASVVADLTDTLRDLTGASDDFEIPDGFLDSEENLKLIEQAATGSQEAINQLGVALAYASVDVMTFNEELAKSLGSNIDASQFENYKNIVLSGIDQLKSKLGELEVGQDVTSVLGEDWINALNQMAMATGMSVDQMNGLLGQLGVQAKVETKSVKQEMEVPTYTEVVEPGNSVDIVTGTNPDGTPHTETVQGVKRYTVPGEPQKVMGYVQVAQISTDENPMTADVTYVGTGGGNAAGRSPGASGTGGKGGGKGGGGGSAPKHQAIKAKKYESMKKDDRYSTIKASIEEVQKSLDKYNDAVDDSWGSAKIRALQQANRELERQAKDYQALYKSAKSYLSIDQKEAAKNKKGLGKKLGLNLIDPTFNKDGFLSNKTEVINQLDDYLQALYQKYYDAAQKYDADKSTDEKRKERIDQMLEEYNVAKEAVDEYIASLDQVDETANEAYEALMKLVEGIRQEIANRVEEITYKMEFRIKINDRDIEWFEHIIDKMGDVGLITGKSFEQIVKSFNSSASSVQTAADTFGELQNLLASLNTKEGQQDFIAKFGQEAWDYYLATGKLSAEVIEGMSDVYDQAFDALNQAYDDFDAMFEQYLSLLDIYLSEFDRFSNQISRQSDQLEAYRQLLDFSGKGYGEDGRAARKSLSDAQISNAKTELARAQSVAKMLEGSVKDSEERLQKFYDTYGKDPSGWDTATAHAFNQIKQTHDEIVSQYEDAQNDITAALTDVIDAATEALEDGHERITEAFVEGFNGLFTSLDSALTQYEWKTDIRDFYLDDYDKNYELDKLLGEIDDAMTDVTDPERLQAWGALQDEINAKMAEGVKITQTDLDILRAQFELEQAKDQYEEAKNAKNTMRLARDASGNWNYVYSSESSEAEDAEQKMKDAMANIHKMHREAADSMSDLWYQTYIEMQKYEYEVDQLRYKNDEQYRAEVDEFRRLYKEKLDFYESEVIKHNGAIDRSFADTVLGQQTGYETMEEAADVYYQANEQYTKELQDNANEYEETIRETCDRVGISYEELEQWIRDRANNIMQSNDDMAEKMEETSIRGSAALGNLSDNIDTYAWSMIESLRALELQVESLYNTLQNLSRWEADVGMNADFGTDYTDYIGTDFYNKYGKDATANDVKDYMNSAEVQQLIKERLYVIQNDSNRGDLHDPKAVYENVYNEVYNSLMAILKDIQNDKGYWTDDNWDFGENGSAKKKRTASGGLIKTPQVRSLAEEGPELVLNKDDTQNILEAVKNMRETIKLKISAMNSSIGQKVQGETIATQSNVETIEQNVKIDATFPGVSVASEIEEALNNLINQAVQYAHKNNR